MRSYGGEILAGRVSRVTRTADDHFRVELVGGHSVVARRVLAATGLVDELPDIEGLAEHWGGDVIHCPFCHGFEVRDRRIVQIVTHPLGLHTAGLFRQLSAQLTVVLHDPTDVDDAELDALRASGVDIVDARVSRIVTGADGHVAAVELAGHDPIDADAVVVAPRFRVRAEPFESLGLRPAAHPSGLGDFVETDATGCDGSAGALRRRQRVRSEPAGVGGRRHRQPGRGDDQLQPRSRRHPSRGPTIGQRGRLGSSLRRRADLERQPERHARQRGRRPHPWPRPRRRRRRGRRRALAGRAGLERDGERHLPSVPWTGSPPRPSAAGCPSSAITPMRTHSVRSPAERSTSCRRSTRRFRAHPMAAVCATSWTRSHQAARCSSSATTSSRCARRSTR